MPLEPPNKPRPPVEFICHPPPHPEPSTPTPSPPTPTPTPTLHAGFDVELIRWVTSLPEVNWDEVAGPGDLGLPGRTAFYFKVGGRGGGCYCCV